MKRMLLCSAVVLFTLQASWSQEKNDKRPIREGQNSLTMYYGATLRAAVYNKVLGSYFETSGRMFGPVGIVYEHMVSDIVGVGAEFSFMQFAGTARLTDIHPDSRQEVSFDLNWSITTIRAMFRANFHFIEEGDFDFYGLVSAGYKRTEWAFNTSYNHYSPLAISFNIFPLGVKPGLGLRYFVNKHVGIVAEITAGTPIVCAGASLKF